MGNDSKKILDIDLQWPGSTQDAGIYRNSEVKEYVEGLVPHYKLAGDTGYPISQVLMKPFLTQQARNDPQKRLFNIRLSGLRTEMSEHIFGMWKRQFPILKRMGYHFNRCQQVVLCTAILHNICIDWGKKDLPDDGEDGPVPPDAVRVQWENLEPLEIRAMGQQERLLMMRGMVAPTNGERHRMARVIPLPRRNRAMNV